MNIYKQAVNGGKLYTLEMVQAPYPFLDGDSRIGLWAYPYKHDGDRIFFKSKDFNGACLDYANDNFFITNESRQEVMRKLSLTDIAFLVLFAGGALEKDLSQYELQKCKIYVLHGLMTKGHEPNNLGRPMYYTEADVLKFIDDASHE